MRIRGAFTVSVLALSSAVACSSTGSTTGASSTPASAAPQTSQSPTAAATYTPTPSQDLNKLKPGDLFYVPSPDGKQARYTSTKDAKGLSHLTINIIGFQGLPAFEPSIITGTPGERIKITVYQTSDRSSHYHHNFSIDELGIDDDISTGPGHTVTETVTLPKSGGLAFYCAYHVTAEQHAGEFLVG